MIPLSYENLRLFVKSREGKAFKTLSRGKIFYVLLIDSGFKYILDSTRNNELPNSSDLDLMRNGPLDHRKESRNQTEKIIKRIVRRYQENNSFKVANYRDIDTNNSSHLLSVIKSYFDSDYSFQPQGALKDIYVGGFKAFAEIQKIPLKKINLIYGGNSSGKSSIIHSLLLANHVINTGNFDVHYPVLSGESVDLGGFNNYVHLSNETATDLSDKDKEYDELKQYRKYEPQDELLLPRDGGGDGLGSIDALHQINRYGGTYEPFKKGVILGFDIPIYRLPNNIRDIFSKEAVLKVIIYINRYVFEKRYFDQDYPDCLCILDDLEKPRVCKCDIFLDEELFLSMILPFSGELLHIKNFNPHSELYTHLINNISSICHDIDPISKIEPNSILDEVIKEVEIKTCKFIPNGATLKTKDDGVFAENNSQENKSLDKWSKEPEIRERIIYVLNRLLNSISLIITERMGALSYLGPLRSYSPREIQYDQQKHLDINWHSQGIHTWDLIKNDNKVRTAVNKWLGSSEMQSPYRLIRTDYIPFDESNIFQCAQRINEVLNEQIIEYFVKSGEKGFSILDKLKKDIKIVIKGKALPVFNSDESKYYDEAEEKVWNYLNTIFDIGLLAKSALRYMIKDDKKSDLALIDIRSKTRVSHRDVGLGISQVIPVLGLSYGAQGKIIAIEQPEIHLHPALQAELADVFIESALGERKNTFLLESHSEHLLLRIMRRMRETFEGKLPDGIPPITPDDVSVLFVEPDGGRSVVREMPLNARGELVKPWPGGFFEEGLKEVFPDVAE